jgi:hypothetical protein
LFTYYKQNIFFRFQFDSGAEFNTGKNREKVPTAFLASSRRDIQHDFSPEIIQTRQLDSTNEVYFVDLI